MDDHESELVGDDGAGSAKQPHWSRFSVKALLVFVMLLSVALVAFQFGYQMGRTVTVVDLVKKGWIPPKRP